MNCYSFCLVRKPIYFRHHVASSRCSGLHYYVMFGKSHTQIWVRRTAIVTADFRDFRQSLQAKRKKIHFNRPRQIPSTPVPINKSSYHSMLHKHMQLKERHYITQGSMNFIHFRCSHHLTWTWGHWPFALTVSLYISHLTRSIGNTKPSTGCLSDISNMGAARKCQSAAPGRYVHISPCHPVGPIARLSTLTL
jgi:hypothetical protein